MNNNKMIDSESSSIKNECMNLGISNDMQIISFCHFFNEIAFHFQIICLPKQIYAWIGCNSTKFGHLYAAAPTRPNNIVSVSSLLGGTSDNTGAAIARRVVMKTRVPVMLACNIPKDSPLLEAEAEKKLVQKLNALGYTKSRHQGSSS
nr:proteasome assembly chaperone 4 [Tanacetum cinerariifolium]